jgi:hypothetical protein
MSPSSLAVIASSGPRREHLLNGRVTASMPSTQQLRPYMIASVTQAQSKPSPSRENDHQNLKE